MVKFFHINTKIRVSKRDDISRTIPGMRIKLCTYQCGLSYQRRQLRGYTEWSGAYFTAFSSHSTTDKPINRTGNLAALAQRQVESHLARANASLATAWLFVRDVHALLRYSTL